MESSGRRKGSERPRAFAEDLNVDLQFDRFGDDAPAPDRELSPPSFVSETPAEGTPPVERRRERAQRRSRRSRGGGRGRSARRRPQPRDRDRRPRARRPGSETIARILWAVPWVAVAVTIVVVGGITFAAAMVVFAWIGLAELFRMTSSARPLQVVALAAAAAFPVMFLVAAARGSIDGVTRSMAMTAFGVLWIGVPFAHAVLLRELPLHGGALLIDVLVATFVADTSAYAVGRLLGRHKLAPDLSPNKTVEGMIGGFVGGTMGFWFAGLYQDWLPGMDALLMGMVIAILAPIGDLFESMIKRDLGVKDSGHVFGPHGGLLDRLDAVLFTIVAGYYLSVAFVY